MSSLSWAAGKRSRLKPLGSLTGGSPEAKAGYRFLRKPRREAAWQVRDLAPAGKTNYGVSKRQISWRGKRECRTYRAWHGEAAVQRTTCPRLPRPGACPTTSQPSPQITEDLLDKQVVLLRLRPLAGSATQVMSLSRPSHSPHRWAGGQQKQLF